MHPPPVLGSLPLGGCYDLRPRGSLVVRGARELLVERQIPGAFEADGTVAMDTLRATLAAGLTHLMPERPPNDEVVHTVEEEVVWGGQLNSHYGHFVTESVSRLWPLLPGGGLEGLPVVFTHSCPLPFGPEWMTAFGVQPFALPDTGMVRFNRMFVPEPAVRLPLGLEPALRDGAWISPALRDIHLQARAGLDVPSPAPRHDTLWLSRGKLGETRVAYDEGLFEWLLGEHVMRVHLETLTLGEQVALFEGSRAVAGVIGSAFHTLPLAIEQPDCLYLCPAWDKQLYPAQHWLLPSEATFAQGLTMARWRHDRRWMTFPDGYYPFPDGYRLLIPDALRRLNASILPGLLKDPRLASFAYLESQSSRKSSLADSGLDAAARRVVLEPLSTEARSDLAVAFEQEGLELYAKEQRRAIADLS